MHDAALVGVREAIGDLRADVERLRGVDDAAVEQARQLAPLDELHRHVDDVPGVADVVDGDDVRMAEAAGRPRLLVEALLVLFALGGIGRDVDRLDRHRAVQHRIRGPVDDAHRAAPELALQRVPAEALGLAHGLVTTRGATSPGAPRSRERRCLRHRFSRSTRTRPACGSRSTSGARGRAAARGVATARAARRPARRCAARSAPRPRRAPP